MTSSMFLIAVGMLLAGIVMIVVGRRGIRVNRHPVCKQCRFDLEGVYPGAITCPECGAGLKREGWVRIGVRRRIHTLVALGAVGSPGTELEFAL